MKKVLVVTGTRADYGIYYPVLKAMENDSEFDLCLLVTGMHLAEKYGYTINDIKEDGFKIASTVDILLQGSTHGNMARSVGLGILGMTQAMETINPDFVFVLGDRGEMLAAAIVASHLNIPVLHIHGGEVSGTIDESVRHAISKLSHIHLPATEKSAERLMKLGEDPWRVNVVGAPRIETIKNTNLPTFEDILHKYNLDIKSKDYFLYVYHPVTTEVDIIEEEVTKILKVLAEENKDVVCILPNSDAGNEKILEVYEKLSKNKRFNFVSNFSQLDFLTVLANAEAMIGNSSSGIIEAASFKIPVVNIGSRQFRRERSKNVIDTEASYIDIKKAINKMYFSEFQRELVDLKNVYGDGYTSEKILSVLKKVKVNKGLMQKTITY